MRCTGTFEAAWAQPSYRASAVALLDELTTISPDDDTVGMTHDIEAEIFTSWTGVCHCAALSPATDGDFPVRDAF